MDGESRARAWAAPTLGAGQAGPVQAGPVQAGPVQAGPVQAWLGGPAGEEALAVGVRR